MLSVSQIEVGYGDTTVLSGVSLEVHRGETVALLGRNGMGKTTCLLAIMGLNPARSGTIRFGGADITKMPPFEIARRGIGYSPEGRRLFSTLSVLQNLRIPFANKHKDKSAWPAQLDRIFDLFPVLKERSNQRAGSLSGGEQQMVAIARALIGGDEFLVLDEPTEGLAPAIIETIVEAIQTLKQQGLTVLLVEQNAHRAFGIVDRAYVLEKGRVVISGTSQELLERPDELNRFIGVGEEV